MKTQKSYRLSPAALICLEDLKTWFPGMTETEIIEWAIASIWGKECSKHENEGE